MAQVSTIAAISKETDIISERLEKGELAQAQILCTDLLKRFPEHPEALYMQALLCSAGGDHMQAVKLLQRAVAISPQFENAWFNMGATLSRLKMFDEACKVYMHLLSISPKYYQAMFNLAHIFHQAKHLSEAENYYRKFLELTPYHSAANANLGAVLIDQGRFDDALPFCEKAVMLALSNADARNNCAIIYARRGQLDKAETAFKRIITMSPNYVPAQQNLEKLRAMRNAPAVDADQTSELEALFKKANASLAAGKLEEAVEDYEKALTINSQVPEIYINMGMALTMMRQYLQADAVLARALELNPKSPEAYLNRGNLFKSCNQPQPALAAYKKALEYKPDFFEALVNMGVVLASLGDYKESLAAYRKALRLDPKKMLEVEPTQVEALGLLIRDQMQICQWSDVEMYVRQLLKIVDEAKETGLAGFPTSTLLVVDSSAEQQLRSAVRTSNFAFGSIARPYDIHSSLPCVSRTGGKIRIGYLSSDFYNHATAFLISGMFEQHDRSKFEIYAYSYGKDDNSAARKRIQKAVDMFHDIRELSDAQVAQQMKSDGIDIAVDLKGYTTGHRLGISAYRGAPINVHYLGYPGTTGASFMDYFIADPLVAPASLDPWFSEKLVRLPHSYQVNDNKREVAETPSRKECGLPDKGFVFCSFNQNYKITPQIFDVWARILKAVPDSVLWFYITADIAQDNLRGEAQKRGIDPTRLIFATYKPQAEHLARMMHADLFLDTFPINAHTTASDALWCGVPVVTCAGKTFVSRVAASVLSAVGMSELVTENIADYEALALKIAQDPTLLARLKAQLKKARDASPLFNTQATTRQVEAAYQGMIERHKAGKLPEAFNVNE